MSHTPPNIIETYHCQECGKHFHDSDGENEYNGITRPKPPIVTIICYSCKLALAVAAAAGMTAVILAVR